MYYKLDSSYYLAINSVESKMKERLLNAKTAYATLIKFNENTKYRVKADEMLAKIETDLQQYAK